MSKDDFIDDLFDELTENNISTAGIVYKKQYVSQVHKSDVSDILKKRPADDTRDDLWELNQTYQARKKQRIMPDIVVPYLKTNVTTCDIKQEGVRLIGTGFGPTKDGQHTFKFINHAKFKLNRKSDESGGVPRMDYMVNAITSNGSTGSNPSKKRRLFKAHGEEYRVVDNKVVIRQSGLPYQCEGVFIRYGKKLGRLMKILPDDTLEIWYNRVYSIENLYEKFQTFIPLLFNIRLTAPTIYKCFLNMIRIHGYEKRDIPFTIFQRLRIRLHLNSQAGYPPMEPSTRKLKLARKKRMEHYRTHWDYGITYFEERGLSVLNGRAILPVLPYTGNPFVNRIRQNEVQPDMSERRSQPPTISKPFPIAIQKANRTITDIGRILSVFLNKGDHGAYTKMIDTYEKTGHVVRNAGKFYTVSESGLDTFLCCQHEYFIYKNADEISYTIKRGSQTICKFCNTELTPAQDEITYDANGQANITSQDMFIRSSYVKMPVEYPELLFFLTNFYNAFTDYTQHLDKDAILLAVFKYLQKYYPDTLKENELPKISQSDNAFLNAFSLKERETLGMVPFESREQIKAQIQAYQLRRNCIRAGVLCAYAECNLPDVSTLLAYFKIDLDLDLVLTIPVKWNEFNTPEELLRGVYNRACIFTGFIPEPVVNTTSVQIYYPLKQGQTEKIPFAEAVNRIASGTGCSNQTVLVGYSTTEYVLYQMPQTTKPQRNVAQSYIKLLQNYAENRNIFMVTSDEIIEIDSKPSKPSKPSQTRKLEPVKTRNGGRQSSPSLHHSYPNNMVCLSRNDADGCEEMKIDMRIRELNLKVNLKFINQLDEIPLWVSHQSNPQRDAAVNDVDLLATLQQLTGHTAATAKPSSSDADLKIHKLQTIGKELLYFHMSSSERPELRLKAYRSFCPEIYSYDKGKLEYLAKEKKCSSSYLLKLVLQTDVLFHAAKISQKLPDDRLPDTSVLSYFSPKETNPYLRFISDLLNKRLSESNHTIVEYDRYKKWFTQIKAPRLIRTIKEEQEDPDGEDDPDDEGTGAGADSPVVEEEEEEEEVYDPDIDAEE
jgi:hypothetical protein